MAKFDEINAREALLEAVYLSVESLIKKSYLTASKRIINEIMALYSQLDNGENILVSDLYKYNRYYKLLNSINDELNALGSRQEVLIYDCLDEMYRETTKIVGSSINFDVNINTQLIKNVINTVWVNDGLMWSDRIWNNKEKLFADLSSGIIEIIATGRSPEDLKQLLVRDFDISYNKANRLVRTELKRIEIQASIDEYKRAGIKKYIYLTARDDEVCNEPEYCKVLDGKSFPIDDTEHLPPQHPNCRCSVLADIDY